MEINFYPGMNFVLSTPHQHVKACLGIRCLQRPPWFPRCFKRHLSYTTTSHNGDQFIVSGTIPQNGHGLALNQYAEVRRVFTEDDIHQFGQLIGDSNPLHSSSSSTSIKFPWDTFVEDDNAGNKTELHEGIKISSRRKPLVHGILAGSVFSCIFGTLIPGSVYRHQVLNFRQPIFADERVVGRVQVTKVRSVPRSGGLLVVCDTTVHVLEHNSEFPTLEKDVERQRLRIEGHAQVWLPTGRLLYFCNTLD
jgi:3-hydroxybutyryl-CoA dehydratase